MIKDIAVLLVLVAINIFTRAEVEKCIAAGDVYTNKCGVAVIIAIYSMVLVMIGTVMITLRIIAALCSR